MSPDPAQQLPILKTDCLEFPNLDEAIRYREGLVAIGGDLSPERLLSAYQQGVFPWFSEPDPICWWASAPRMVLFPEQLSIGRSLQKTLRHKAYEVTMNGCFQQVMTECASVIRPRQSGTWINTQMIEAYTCMAKLGFAHSFECWMEDKLAGGFYGIWIDRVFFGESMFARKNDASKIAFVHGVHYLQSQGVQMIDCQMNTPHLVRFGAGEISFADFSNKLKKWCQKIEPRLIYNQLIHESTL